jgi:hypothetical protein
VSICALVVAVVLSASGGVPPAQAWKSTPPESFRANAQANSESGGAAAAMTFQIDAYTPDASRTTLLAALASGGSPAFVEALKKEKGVGYVQAGDRKVTIRYARAEAAGKDGRRVVLVTDAPVYFVGGGALDAAPTAGFDIAVVQFEVDSVGLGSGTMAAAARVKPGGATGVQVDDYALKPINLVTVTRNTK